MNKNILKNKVILKKTDIKKLKIFLIFIILLVIFGSIFTFKPYIFSEIFEETKDIKKESDYNQVSTTSPPSSTSITTVPSTTSEEIQEGNIKIKIESPLNKNYGIENIILKVVASNTTNWMVDSIDGRDNITECYNCGSYTLYYLKFDKGTHTITVYASDYENRVSKASVTFTVV